MCAFIFFFFCESECYNWTEAVITVTDTEKFPLWVALQIPVMYGSLTVTPNSVNELGQGKKNSTLVSFEHFQRDNELFCEGCLFFGEPVSALESWSQNNCVQAGNLNISSQTSKKNVGFLFLKCLCV